MNPLDVWFLHAEDPCDQLHIGSVGVFAGPPPAYPELLDLVERKLPRIERYRQRVRRVPLDLARPVWVDDPDFSLRHHVHHTALPAPGGDTQLRDLVGRVMSQALDHQRPLWEMWLVEGLAGDRWAVVSKVHHCLVDGVAGVDLVATLLSLTPEVDADPWQSWSPQPQPAPRRLVRDALGDRLSDLGGVVRGTGWVLRHPDRSLRTAATYVRGAAELLRLAALTPRTSLNGPIGPHRRWTWAAADLADVRRVREAFGGTYNDVFLAAVTRGFRDLLRERHELADMDVLRTLVPVSIRHEDEHGLLDNRVAAMFATLPIDVGDPVQRLHAVQAEMQRLKASGEDGATALLVASSGLTPPWLLRLGMGAITRVVQRTGQRAVNTVTTNVPGPQVPLHLLGRRLLEVHPYVPVAEGVRVGVAIFTYDGRVSFGLTGDAATTEDLGVLAEGIEDGVRELVQAADHRRVTTEVS